MNILNLISKLSTDIYFKYNCSSDESLHHANNIVDEMLAEPYIQYLQLRWLI